MFLIHGRKQVVLEYMRSAAFVRRRRLGLFGLVLALSGCATPPTARYVYQDGEYGVIGIPQNTFLDKTNYRGQAEMLMARHFPEGYEIVRAEEVVEGQRMLDIGKRTEINAEPILSASSQTLKLGRLDRASSFSEKDQLQLRESRIIYRKRPGASPQTLSAFSPVATLTPPLYINPNEFVTRPDGTRVLAQALFNPTPASNADPKSTPTAGDNVKKTSNPTTK